MVPGAAHRFPHQQPFRQRAAVMRAARADGEEFLAAAREQHALRPHMAGKHAAIGQVGELDAQ